MMEIKKIDHNFSVCQVEDYSLVNLNSEYSFIGKTDEEKSLVCITDEVPANVIQRDDGWKAFRIQGVLDFSLIGILAKIAAALADNGISIFAVSTYHRLINKLTFSWMNGDRFATDDEMNWLVYVQISVLCPMP